MPRFKLLPALSCFLLASFCINTSLAAEDAPGFDDDDEDGAFSFALGLVGFTEPSAYLDGKRQTEVFPYIELEYGRFFFQGGALGFHLLEGENWQLSTAATFDFMGDSDRGKSRTLRDMTKLDDAFNGSLIFSYEADWGTLDTAISTDISSTHKGSGFEISYGYPIKLNKWMIEPSVEISWASDKAVQYYHGVKQSEVTANRAFYQPDATINYGIGVNAIYPLDDKQAIMLQLESEFYGSEIKDSPIVDRSSAVSFGVGYIYRF